MWIKICGVTRSDDVLAVIQAGADAIGLNFFPGSKRFVSSTTALTLARAARERLPGGPEIDLVGVFVNAAAHEVQETAEFVGLNAIQLHGDETPEQVDSIHMRCPGIPIIRALRVDPKDRGATLRDIDRLTALVPVSAILLDAFVPGEFGGTGARVDPEILREYFAEPRPPLILAGGLTPSNVASLTTGKSLWGIDTASGVESSPGIKEPALIQEFVKAVRDCGPVSDSTARRVRIGDRSIAADPPPA